MTKRGRFILFSFLVILFFLIAPAAIFYSQGYRFDFDGRKIVRTGGLYFKVQPRGAQIYLDGKLIKETDFLFGRALIDNLAPQKYKVEIKKEGYFPWEKQLEVQERWVTEAKNVFLVLQNPKLEILKNNIEDFFFSPDLKKIVIKKGGRKGWSLNLLNLEKNIETLLFAEKEIGQKEAEILDFKWSADSKKILLNLTPGEPRYFIFELDKEDLIPLDFLEREIDQVSFDPKNSQKIFFIKNSVKQNNLFSADYLKKKISGPILKDVINYQISNNSLFWLDKNGFIIQSDLSGRKIANFNIKSHPLEKAAKYQIMIFQENIFLREDDNLYFFDEKEKSFEKTSEKVNKVKVSPDFKKIVYFTDYAVWILFLEEITEQPQRNAREKLFLTRFSEKIGDIFWYTSHYLVFNTGNSIKITEIDDRDKINVYDFVEFEKPPKESDKPDPTGQAKIFWNQNNKSLYILSRGNLYFSQKLY